MTRERDMFTGPLMDEITWVRPKLVAQMTYVEWPVDGLLRHAKFIALRNDKKARDVVRET